MEFFDGWKTLNARFDEGDLTALTQLVGYKLFVIFDEQRFPESLPISDRELMSRTGIQSTRTIVEARRRLKNAGLIDFETRHGKITRYRLIAKETVGKQLVNSCQTVAEIPNKRARDRYTPVFKEEGTCGRKELTAIWADEMHRPLGDSERYELPDLEERYGYEAVKAAIIKTRQSRCYPTFADFKAILRGKSKGGDTRDRGIVYEAVDTDWIQAADG